MVEISIWAGIFYGCQIWLSLEKAIVGKIRRNKMKTALRPLYFWVKTDVFVSENILTWKYVPVRTIRHHQVLLIPHERSSIQLTNNIFCVCKHINMKIRTIKYYQVLNIPHRPWRSNETITSFDQWSITIKSDGNKKKT